MATYRCLVDLFLPSLVYAQAGSLLSDAVPTPQGYLQVPPNWSPPTGGVDPMDSDAISKYFAVGPRGLSNASPHISASVVSVWSNQPVGPPVVYWKPATAGGEAGFSLAGQFHEPVNG